MKVDSLGFLGFLGLVQVRRGFLVTPDIAQIRDTQGSVVQDNLGILDFLDF